MSTPTLASLIAQVKSELSGSVLSGNLNASNILTIAKAIIEDVSSIAGLSHAEKKTLIIRVVDTALKQTLTSTQLTQVDAKMALDMLPSVLDIAMGAVSAKSLETAGWNCLTSCLSFVKKDVLVVVPPSILAEMKAVVESAPVKAVVPTSIVADAEVALHLLEPVIPMPLLGLSGPSGATEPYEVSGPSGATEPYEVSGPSGPSGPSEPQPLD